MSEMLIVVKYSGQSCIPHARGGYSTHQSKSTIRKHISSTFNILHLKQKPVFFATFILWCHVSLHLHITTAANSALCRRRRNEDDLPFGIHWWVLVDIPQCLLELN
uniref:Ovule protein n=1 Tax=Mesocestoides corti TaxID=53468 RepID=A0A5K3FQN7_MESCO